MRAGVRPGLQILWVCLWWTGRFDSDTLPPDFSDGPFDHKKASLENRWRGTRRGVGSRIAGRTLLSVASPPLGVHFVNVAKAALLTHQDRFRR